MSETVLLSPDEVKEAVREFVERRKDGKVTKVDLAGVPSNPEFGPIDLSRGVTASCAFEA